MDPLTTLAAPFITSFSTGLPAVMCIMALIATAYSVAKVAYQHWAGGQERTGRGLLADMGDAAMAPGYIAIGAFMLTLVAPLFV